MSDKTRPRWATHAQLLHAGSAPPHPLAAEKAQPSTGKPQRCWWLAGFILSLSVAGCATESGPTEIITGNIAHDPGPVGKADGPNHAGGSFVIDNASESEEYGVTASTAWWTSTSTPGYLGQNYLVAPTDQSNDPAVFWFKSKASRCFDVAARWTAGGNRSSALTWVARDKNKVELGRATVNQKTKGGTWNHLGRWTFPAGRNEILLSRWATDPGYAVADAVRLSACEGAPPNETPAANGANLDVPYFLQYNNQYEGWATCGLTSAAMAINWWFPGRTTPDKLYNAYGKAQGQSPSTIATLYGWEGLTKKWTTTGTRGEIRAHLDQGRPVVAHGFWTGSGHIVVIVGYDANDWIVNDPAGNWAICYGSSCGSGDHVRYPRGGSWDQKLSSDGDVWFSVSDPNGF